MFILYDMSAVLKLKIYKFSINFVNEHPYENSIYISHA